ncbi:MAG TPA: PAS domain S-box protein, partial [Candidatus Wallbacteria bacterium]|nr:PAS domain S-box protein [Candidatus Wallbacteria bacterium]
MASEDRFRMMIENTPVGVCIIDEYGMFEYVNTAFTELYEYEQDELIGKHITLIILENLYELAMKNYNDFMKGNIPLSREWSASTKNGKKVTVLVNSAKITDLSGCQKSLLFIVDITERQKMEQELIKSREILKAARDSAESLNRQKSRFLASVSHDIRTPLNSVIGFSELIEQSELSETQREMVRCIKNSGNDLLALINDILDLSKIEAGKFEIENAPFDIKETFASAVKSISPLAGKKGLKINVSIDPGIDRLVISDSHRYKQVINNLLSNAVKFTAEGEIKAELKIVALCEMYYTIQTSVSDTGIGIPAEMHERL